jgi:pSer/pThr/pTyr-binding forkhead associated (FHA) protein
MSSGPSTLVLVYGHAGEHRVPLSDGRLTIGRAFSSDIRLDDIHVSRAHAALTVRGSEVWLDDLGSSGGTLVNLEEVTSPRAIRSGDQITLGTVNLWLEGGENESASSTISQAQEPRVQFGVGTQSAGMINNVGRNQYLSYVQHVQQQRASFAREIAATKTKARWFIWLGIAIMVLGLVAFGRMVLRFMQAIYDSFLTGQEPDLGSIFGEKILGLSSGLFGFAIGAAGEVMIILGIIFHITATARRRRMERELPLPPPWAASPSGRTLR